MNLASSIITSLIIVTIFWGTAFFQDNIAHAIQSEKISQKIQYVLKKEQEQEQSVTNITNTTNLKSIQIAGIHQQIELTDIKLLWQEFINRTELHKYLKQQPKKIYVLYQKLSKNYKQAEVTIGYDINELTKFDKDYSIDTSHYTVLLPAKKYDETQLYDAWEKINYGKIKEYVLEVHTLNKSGETTTTQLFVSYK